MLSLLHAAGQSPERAAHPIYPPFLPSARPLPCALPLEEALDWSTFATLVDVYDMKGLDEQLKCLLPRVRGLQGGG